MAQTHPDNPHSATAIPVVGIGASAGGLESLRRFLGAMPPDTGAGLVIVQHLQHGRKSIMPEIIDGYTSMPVREAAEGESVAPDTVHILPADRILTIESGVLHLESWTDGTTHRAVIDEFFASLAADQASNAVAIVLSGAGSDGTLGVREIKNHGGLAMAETIDAKRETEGFASMPDSAKATGLVDFAVPATEMPAFLADYAAYLRDLFANKGVERVQSEASQALPEIRAMLLARKGRDFRNHKPNTLVRRIQRRMQVLGLETGQAYIQHLRGDTDELQRIASEFVISVTRFFRDADAFETLKSEVIVPLMRKTGADESLRIWVPGCGTGEEAYSVAMLALEARAELGTRTAVRVIGTDIDSVSIDTARTGRYPRSINRDVSEQRLQTFFESEHEHYRINKETRDVCIFAEHDLIENPPFSHIDLILCRNLLIYLDTELQKKLVGVFHYALRDGGYLFLGGSENVPQNQPYFTTIDKTHRIFRRVDHVERSQVAYSWPPASQPSVPVPAAQSETTSRQSVLQRAQRAVLDRYGPAYVVVDDSLNVVQFSAGTGPFLEQPGGTPRSNVLEIARPGLRAPLRTLLHKVRQARREIVQPNINVTLASQDAVTVDLVVSPLAAGEADTLFLVVFRRDVDAAAPQPATVDASEVSSGAESDSRVQALERELAATREDLQTTIEEMETSNEELQSANEELLSINEELQSANEELETAKEETQSVNEELEAVNAELNRKVAELNQVNDDLTNLLESTDIATIFLDSEWRIKWFAPTARRVFRLIETDVGRPITDIAAHFDTSGLYDDLRAVLADHRVRERTVSLADRPETYSLQIRPYRSSDGHVNGLVMTFQDITDLTDAARQQRLLVAALQHRVRNMLATVRSLARESRDASDSLDAFFERFDGRLNALATSEGIVSRTREGRVDIAELVEEAVPDALRGEGDNVRIEGESISLDPRAAQLIALALNELATNAIKFGAFAGHDGTVDLSWREEQDKGTTWLHLVWRESGIARLEGGPERRGFGLDLIENGLPYELGGHAQVVFADQTLTCSITIPAHDADAAAGPESGEEGEA